MGEAVRLRLDVAYDGGGFSGWASQPGRRTVQAIIETALAQILRIPRARLTVAGRTDAGVHARAQVCHVDVPVEAWAGITPDRLTYRLARLLPEDVRVRRIALAPDGFDARFSAAWRRYAYRLSDDPLGVDPLLRHTVLWWPRHLNVPAMDRAAQPLLGEHDFAAFCKPRDGATTVRTMRELSWAREADLVTAWIVADAFCHNMVRSLVGCLLVVGEGRQGEEWPGQVLQGRARDPGVPVVASHGLTLEGVGYPPDAELATHAVRSRALRTLA